MAPIEIAAGACGPGESYGLEYARWVELLRVRLEFVPSQRLDFFGRKAGNRIT